MCGQPHQVIPVGKEFLARFPHYAERAVYLTDGCVDMSRAPDLYLNERAREIAPVRMTGNYGGEVLRRVRTFKPVEPLPGLFRPRFSPTSTKQVRRMQGSFRCTRFPLPFSSRARGIITGYSPWNRRSSHCGLHSSTTI